MEDEEAEKKAQRARTASVLGAVVIAFACLGTVFVMFPISNPLTIIGGGFGAGIFYAALISLILFGIFLFFMAIKSSLRDIAISICEELGIDFDEVTGDFKKMIKDDVLVIAKKKKPVSDHHNDE